MERVTKTDSRQRFSLPVMTAAAIAAVVAGSTNLTAKPRARTGPSREADIGNTRYQNYSNSAADRTGQHRCL